MRRFHDLVCAISGSKDIRSHFIYLEANFSIRLRLVASKFSHSLEPDLILWCSYFLFLFHIGADKAIHVETDKELEPLAVAKLSVLPSSPVPLLLSCPLSLREVLKKESADLVITGKQAIDDDSNQTAQLLAGLMGWSQATFASKVRLGSLIPETSSRPANPARPAPSVPTHYPSG